jgi:hypothetical protein
MTNSDRSPILKRPLKLPGQDADDDLQNFVADHIIAPMMILLVIFSMCIVECAHYESHSPPNPWVYTCWFAAAAIVITAHWRKQWGVAMAKKLGRDGERAVSEYLNIWLTADARVLHNLPIDNGIADHVLICCKGVIVIETKTRTLPTRGDPIVHDSDAGLRVSGFKPDRDPLAQIKRYMSSLDRILLGFDGVMTRSAGVIVFPGWKIVDDRSRRSDIAVLNPRDLEDHFRDAPNILSSESVLYLTRKLAQHSRAHRADGAGRQSQAIQ